MVVLPKDWLEERVHCVEAQAVGGIFSEDEIALRTGILVLCKSPCLESTSTGQKIVVKVIGRLDYHENLAV